MGANFNRDRRGIFHYTLFADTLAVGGPVTVTTVGLGESGSANDDFTVAAGPLLTIPALSAGHTVDTDRDGFPDLGGAPLFGPLGLPVIGTIADHANIFIHELGHNLGLRHGAFGIDGAPNYLSIMSIGAYRGLAFDNVGNDGIADTTGVDFNGDGIVDTQRSREPEGREWFLQRCRDPRDITFEEFSEDTRVKTQYAPTVTFLADAHREPMVVGPAGRNNVSTASPDHSLLNRMHESDPAVYDARAAVPGSAAPATGADPRDCGCCQCFDKPYPRRSPPCPPTYVRIN